MVSPIDTIWALEYTCNKHVVSYHFQSCRLSDAQDWYQHIYHRLPNQNKRSLPPFVDIIVQQETIRIPLDYFKEKYKQGQVESNLNMSHVKSAVVDLFSNLKMKNWKLVWTLDHYLEPVDEKAHLIGCQLIEQCLQLELRQQPFITNKVMYEGLLTQKTTRLYTLLYGHQLFFLDECYFNNTNYHPKTWFSATTVIKKSKLKKRLKNINFSTPQLASTLCLPPPDPSKLALAKSVLDLTRVNSVKQSEDQQGMIEISLKEDLTLYYQAPDTTSQREWISLIRKNMLDIKSPRIELFDSDMIVSSLVHYMSKRIIVDILLVNIVFYQKMPRKVCC